MKEENFRLKRERGRVGLDLSRINFVHSDPLRIRRSTEGNVRLPFAEEAAAAGGGGGGGGVPHRYRGYGGGGGGRAAPGEEAGDGGARAGRGIFS